MGESEGEDGAKGRAKSMSKHIVFEDGSLDGSDEDERAVEVRCQFVPRVLRSFPA